MLAEEESPLVWWRQSARSERPAFLDYHGITINRAWNVLCGGHRPSLHKNSDAWLPCDIARQDAKNSGYRHESLVVLLLNLFEGFGSDLPVFSGFGGRPAGDTSNGQYGKDRNKHGVYCEASVTHVALQTWEMEKTEP
jgi:hypothetical protein